MWLAWYDNKGAPAFDRNAEGRLVLKAGSKSLTTYAPFMDLVVKEGEVFGRCIIQGCDSPASEEGIRLTYDPKVNLGNFIEHLWCSHEGVFLTAQDYNAKAAAAAADPRKRARGKGGGGRVRGRGRGRGRGQGRGG